MALILTIESTCDETAAAVISDQLAVLSSVVASQDKLHERFGGVVPEIASRAHVERILPVIDEALRKAGVTLAELDAVAVARSIFERYSFDLIYARPRQTLSAWEIELKRAIAEAAEHLSLYQLTIEAGTPFFGLHKAGKLIMPDDDLARDLYDLTQAVCADAGLPAYEISNHARPGAVEPGPARTDCRLHVGAQPLPVLTEGARRSCGGTAGRPRPRERRAARRGIVAAR